MLKLLSYLFYKCLGVQLRSNTVHLKHLKLRNNHSRLKQQMRILQLFDI